MLLLSSAPMILPTTIRRSRCLVKLIHMRDSHFAKDPRYSSRLARIDTITDDPVDLFRSWRDIAKRTKPDAPDLCCLATASKDSKVGARNVIVREFDNNGFVFVTDSRSRKANDMKDTPNAAMCFCWHFTNESNQHVIKQVRIEGPVKILEKVEYQYIYDGDPLYAKIRAYICDQDREIDWDDLKRRHDQLLDDVIKGKNDLPMPDHFVGYKLQPLAMDFYYAGMNEIADRMYYWRDDLNVPWRHRRIAA